MDVGAESPRSGGLLGALHYQPYMFSVVSSNYNDMTNQYLLWPVMVLDTIRNSTENIKYIAFRSLGLERTVKMHVPSACPLTVAFAPREPKYSCRETSQRRRKFGRVGAYTCEFNKGGLIVACGASYGSKKACWAIEHD
jgi:hypothetical protein